MRWAVQCTRIVLSPSERETSATRPMFPLLRIEVKIDVLAENCCCDLVARIRAFNVDAHDVAGVRCRGRE